MGLFLNDITPRHWSPAKLHFQFDAICKMCVQLCLCVCSDNNWVKVNVKWIESHISHGVLFSIEVCLKITKYEGKIKIKTRKVCFVILYCFCYAQTVDIPWKGFLVRSSFSKVNTKIYFCQLVMCMPLSLCHKKVIIWFAYLFDYCTGGWVLIVWSREQMKCIPRITAERFTTATKT